MERVSTDIRSMGNQVDPLSRTGFPRIIIRVIVISLNILIGMSNGDDLQIMLLGKLLGTFTIPCILTHEIAENIGLVKNVNRRGTSKACPLISSQQHRRVAYNRASDARSFLYQIRSRILANRNGRKIGKKIFCFTKIFFRKGRYSKTSGIRHLADRRLHER